MLNSLIIIGGRLASSAVKKLNLGHGSTWPGHLALQINPQFVQDMLRQSGIKTIIIAGTNGKTTSSLMLRSVLEADGKKVLHNESGANLMNGIASTILLNASYNGIIRADYAVFEVDENALPKVLQAVKPDYLLLLNLFRDQLDRYGEVATIFQKWELSLTQLPDETVIITNADDPRTAYLGMQKKQTIFFGLPKQFAEKITEQEATDSTYCPKCHNKLSYRYKTYSHLGDWYCTHCHLKRPDLNISKDINLSLSGTYNLYNAHGIIALAQNIGIPDTTTAKALQQVKPAFGRQEKISSNGKQTQLFLVKNPTGFTESLKTITALKGKYVLIVLNDGAADGTDVSWIWDIDFASSLSNMQHISISGTRAFDMGLRLKYAYDEPIANSLWHIDENPETAITKALDRLPEGEVLYILPTYTAMLEVRKILTGRKIL